MNFELKMHNIRIAWRNLMKYKVQNIISVLCLAVGMVSFSMCFIFLQRGWQMWTREGRNPRRALVELYAQDGSLISDKPAIFQRISDSYLPSINFIDINLPKQTAAADYISPKGRRYTAYTTFRYISPEHLNYLGLRSAITGKHIPVLKSGDIIMTKGMLERTFGKDVNPIGFTIDDSTLAGKRTITDVVDTGDWWLSADQLMLVTDMFKEYQTENIPCTFFYIILAKGKTGKDLQKELQQVLPEYKVEVECRPTSFFVEGIVTIMIISSSILLIGLFGFLKTQIQLFRLRHREMGLRQCMGAQREQLFGLMMWEVAFIFFFVTLLTLVLTSLLVDFAVPFIQIHSPNFFVDMPRTYITELWLCLTVFLLTVGIAVLSVRKVVTTPLSKVVGKSHRTSTRGRSLLIILQMVVCISFLNFALSASFLLAANSETPANEDAFRSSFIIDKREWKDGLLNRMPHLQNVEGSTHVVSADFMQDLRNGEKPLNARNVDSVYMTSWYNALLTDENLFDLLDIEILPESDDMHRTQGIRPVYAPTELADQLRKKFNLPKMGEPERLTIVDSLQAEKIGYVQMELLSSMIHRGNFELPVILYIYEKDFFMDKRLTPSDSGVTHKGHFGGWLNSHNIIFKSKPDEYKAAIEELTDIYQKEYIYTQTKVPMDNLFDVCFKELRTGELTEKIDYILAVVALLCIVLTLYSSVSLDTRGRQKEVAIRKAHGAGKGQIMWLFGKQYFWQIIISSIISLLLYIGYLNIIFAEREINTEDTWVLLIPYFLGVFIIFLITLLSVGYKLYKVSKVEPASIIKKE